MGRRLAVYLAVVVVAGPLLAYRVAVAGANHHVLGLGGFLLVLVGTAVAVAVLVAVLLRVGGRRAGTGVVVAVAATIALVTVLVLVELSR